MFRGAADELEQRRPFGAIGDCLGIGRRATDSRRAAIARLLTEDQGGGIGGGWFGDAPQAEFRVVEAVVALVEELSARSPVMMAVEDLQWADPSTLLVLHRLGRQVRQLPILLVCTARPVPRSQELERCLQGLRAGGAAELALGPLDAVAVAQLVERLVDAAPGPSLRRQVMGAGGNPLFVTELVGALQRDGAIQLGPDGTAELTTVDLPPACVVRRDEEYAILGANVVVELTAKAGPASLPPAPGRSSAGPNAPTATPATVTAVASAGRPTVPPAATAPADPTNLRSGGWLPMPADPTPPEEPSTPADSP